MLPLPAGAPFPNALLLSRQGMRPRRNHYHYGIDLGAPRGTPGGTVAPGVVEEVCWAGSSRCTGYGNAVLVWHGSDLQSWYAHCDDIFVVPGDAVWPLAYGGNPMYTVGVSFGTPEDPGRTLAVPHLHLELQHEGWPDAIRGVEARYDILRELAAVGVGLEGEILVAGLDPFDYHEPLLVADVTKATDFSPAPPELRWGRRWPIYAGLAVVLALGAFLAWPRRAVV